MPKKFQAKQWGIIAGALVLCAAIFVGIREDVFLPEPKVAPVVERQGRGDAYPVKPKIIPPKEEAREEPPAVPAQIEEEKPKPEEVPPPVKEEPPPVVIETPAPPVVVEPPPVKEEPPPVVEKPKVAPPVVKKQAPLPEIKKPKTEPKPEEPAPVPESVPSPPVVIEEPLPPLPEVKKPVRTMPKLRPTYFVNREVISNDIEMFPRWTGMLSRYAAEAQTLEDVCGKPPHTPCKLKEWKDFLISIRDEPLLEKLRQVNRFLNKYPYIDDVVNWGFDNYWETPYEFQRKSGNCKDYAIAKFMSLRAIGVPNDMMRIVVLKDLNLGGIIHAILVVSDDEKSYILDNQIKQVVTTDKVYHYVPIYSINEEHWWQHFVLE